MKLHRSTLSNIRFHCRSQWRHSMCIVHELLVFVGQKIIMLDKTFFDVQTWTSTMHVLTYFSNIKFQFTESLLCFVICELWIVFGSHQLKCWLAFVHEMVKNLNFIFLDKAAHKRKYYKIQIFHTTMLLHVLSLTMTMYRRTKPVLKMRWVYNFNKFRLGSDFIFALIPFSRSCWNTSLGLDIEPYDNVISLRISNESTSFNMIQ